MPKAQSLKNERIDVTSKKFYQDFKKEIKSHKAGDLDEFIKKELGIIDIMSVDFPNISDASIEKFNTNRVRGSVELMKRKLMTSLDEEELFMKLERIKL